MTSDTNPRISPGVSLEQVTSEDKYGGALVRFEPSRD
jgi:hypothetical protein